MPLSVAQLSGQAELILQGTVLSKTCQRDPAGRIFTRVELQVAEVWKGTLATNRFALVHGGGVLGEERVSVSGQVAYGVGEEVVAFLVLNSRGEGVTLGLAQGKFSLRHEAGVKLASNPFHGVNAATHLTRSALKPAMTNTVSAPLTLVELKRAVREASR